MAPQLWLRAVPRLVFGFRVDRVEGLGFIGFVLRLAKPYYVLLLCIIPIK